MSIDLADLTGIREGLGEAAVLELTRLIAGEQSKAIEAHGGVVQDFDGDGVTAVFGAPIAMEDAALRACRTALDIQHKMDGLESEIGQRYGVRPQLRIGIHTGPAVVAKIGEGKFTSYNALGDTVTVAAGLQACADPGSVYITRATLDLVQGFVDATQLGERTFKGKAHAIEIFRLDAIHSGVTRFAAKRRHALTGLRGRDVELALLQEHWNVVKAGRFRSVNVIGDAGLGKSRLIFEFTQSLRDQPVLLLEAICRPEAAAHPFMPVIELMRRWFGIADDGLPRDQIEAKLTHGLQRLDVDVEASLPYLLNLLSAESENSALAAMPASELVGVRIREALHEVVLGWCRLGAPVVLVVEDLHWIDSASQSVLDDIVRNATDQPLLLVCSFRPQFQPVWPAAPEAADLRLTALTNVIAAEIIRERLEGRALPEDLVRLGVAKSEGNPLFAEEFAHYLSHKGAQLEVDEDAGLGGSGELADIPTSLENLIMDRVHRLGRETISLLQAASVLGRQFPMSLAGQMAEIDGMTSQLLPQLELHGLIFPVDRERHDTPADYAFRHALVQDALYASLLTPQRASLHQRAGEALEASYGKLAADIADMLAHHFVRTRRSDKAVYYLSLAAKKSLRVFSLAEARTYLDQALERIAEEPDCADDQLLAEIVVDRLLVCCWEADFIGMVSIADQYRARLEAAGDSRELSRILSWLGEGYLNAARFDEAEQVLDRGRKIGEDLEDEECIAYAMWDQMWLYMVTPDGRPFGQIQTMGERVLLAARRLKDPYLETLTYFLLSFDPLQRGDAASAAKWAAKLIDLGRRTRYPPAQSLGLVCSAWAASCAEDHGKALIDSKLAIGSSHGEFESIMADSAQGVVLVGAGRASEGLVILQRALRQVFETKYLVQLTVIEIPAGIARAMSGDYAGGVADLEAALVRFSTWRNKRMLAWGHLALGEIYRGLAAKAPSPEVVQRDASFFQQALPETEARARKHLDEAINLANKADAPGFAARGLAGLGFLDQAAGRPEAARQRLEEARAIAEGLGAQKLVERIHSALQR
jgi:class 3 adenylate cyclase/tetratricopeptide (TPR) repeat protein